MVEVGDVEAPLCGELAAAVARFVTRSCRHGSPGKRGATFYHDAFSHLETATSVLKSFGLITPVPSADQPDEAWYCYHALALDADEMPGFLALSVGNDDERFPELFQSFLNLACEYDDLPTSRKPFECPQAYRAAARMLEQAGFLQQVGDRYSWTEKATPAMRTLGCWNTAGESWDDIEEARIERESEVAIETMPDDILRAFESGPDDLLSWIVVLETRWIDGGWQEASDRRVSLPEAIGLARRVIEKFKAKLGTGCGDGPSRG